MKVKSALAVLAALALVPSAHAHISATLNGSQYTVNGGSDGTQNSVVTVNISGIETWDALGDASNIVLLIDMAAELGLPSGSTVTLVSIGWNTNQTAFGNSWLSEMGMYFDDNIAPDNLGLFLRPGAGTNTPGNGSFNSAGMVDLSDAGIANVVLPNGILRLEFYESFNDVSDAADGIFNTLSEIYIGVAEVPAPGALALLGIAGLTGARRRRA